MTSTAFWDDLVQKWRAGEKRSVEAALAGQPDQAECRVALSALRFLEAQASDSKAELKGVEPAHRWIALNTLLSFGTVSAAQRYASAVAPAGSAKPLLANLAALVLQAPPTPQSQSDDEFADNVSSDVQVVRRAGARAIMLVFTSGSHRFGGPLVLLHQWLRQFDVHIVYLRDLDGMFYVAGVRSFGPDIRATLEGLRGLARDLAAERFLCIGNSAGCFGALSYGLALGADGVLCIAGPSRLDASLPRILKRHRQLRPGSAPIAVEAFDVPAAYAGSLRRPRVRLVFGSENEIDREEADNMKGLAGMEMDPLPGVEQHNVLPLLGGRGLSERLEWLLRAEAVDLRGA